jgi:crotonobetainyl-CoA:carnitine CoA-transferase CaiB-like acyl-CoA transferase
VTLPADTSGQNREIETLTALLPLALDGERLPLRSPPPALGSHTVELLTSLAYSQQEIEGLREAGIIGIPSS